jgi:hypothetical protein
LQRDAIAAAAKRFFFFCQRGLFHFNRRILIPHRSNKAEKFARRSDAGVDPAKRARRPGALARTRI